MRLQEQRNRCASGAHSLGVGHMLIPEAPGAAQPPVLVGPARWLQVVDEQSDQYFRVTFRTRMKTSLAAGTFHSVGGAELEFVSGNVND